jgi:hypothetical protein
MIARFGPDGPQGDMTLGMIDRDGAMFRRNHGMVPTETQMNKLPLGSTSP